MPPSAASTVSGATRGRSGSGPGARPRARGGAVSILLVLALGILLGMAALVIDLGYATLVRTQLQNAADAAAHAGATHLDGTDAGLLIARHAAATVAAANVADGAAVLLDPDADVDLGVWDRGAGTFSTGGAATQVNAVRVRASRTALPALFSAPAFGRDHLEARVVSVANRQTTGAGEVACFLPLAIPGCIVDWHGVPAVNMVTLTLNPVGRDNAAWARPGANPNASWLRSQIGDCAQEGTLAVDDAMNLNNGVITSALADLADAVAASSTTWDTATWGPLPPRNANSGIPAAKYGRVYEGPVAIVDIPAHCTAPSPLNMTAPVLGFVWGAVYDVVTKGAAAGKNVLMRIDTTGNYDVGTGPGGPDYGIEYRKLALVQ